VALFTIADVLRIGSLSAVLTELVFDHPDIRAFSATAAEVARKHCASFYEMSGLVVPVYGHHEYMMPLKYFHKEDAHVPAPPSTSEAHEDTELEALLDLRCEPEGVCYEAINVRARTLFNWLQDRVLIGEGHTIDGHLMRILHTIWGHEFFYIHPPTGDIYEAGPGIMTKRWTGVVLRPGDKAGPPNQSRRVGPKSAEVRAVLTKAGIDINVCVLGPKEIASRIQHMLAKPPRNEDEHAALAKLISRLRSRSTSPNQI
jgi:hypothetical protein